MSRTGKPTLSEAGQQALAQFEQSLREEEDLSVPTLRNYLSDVRQFMAWCESTWEEGRESEQPFMPTAVATPAITKTGRPTRKVVAKTTEMQVLTLIEGRFIY